VQGVVKGLRCRAIGGGSGVFRHGGSSAFTRGVAQFDPRLLVVAVRRISGIARRAAWTIDGRLPSAATGFSEKGPA
jgi:hypothetical protein